MPKPLIPVNDKPILERIIEWLAKNGVSNIIVGVAYKKDMVKNYFGDGEEFGVKINYVEHDEDGGTEDAFKADLEQAFQRNLIDEENFFAMNGDQITDLELRKLAETHLRNNAMVTITTVNLKTNFGIIETHDDGKIKEFKEKGDVQDKKMNSGIYVFNRRIIDYLLGGNIEENTFKKLINQGIAHSFHHDGFWTTVNDKKELKLAEELLRSIGE